MQKMLAVGVHFGHRARKWNPKMKPYIYAKKNGVHIFDLIATKKCLQDAQKFLSDLAKKGGKVLFLGTKKQAREAVKKWAEKVGAFYLTERWLGGLLTNFNEVEKAVARLRELKEIKSSAQWEELSTRKQHMINREIHKKEKLLGGILGMQEKPQALIVVDPRKEKMAVKEAVEAGIPVVALIDTNGNPELISYPIPGNDDASRSIDLILSLLASALGDVEEETSRPVSKPKPPAEIAGSSLPGRVKNALIKAGYTKLSEVQKVSDEELLAIKGLGKKAVEEIRKQLTG